MRGIAGYRFKDGIITEEQRKVLDEAIVNSADKLETGIEWKQDNTGDVFLSRMDEGTFLIFGVGDRSAVETDGAIWGSDEKELLKAVYYAKIENFFPYKVVQGIVYVIRNAQTYESGLRKDRRVKTSKGEGKIWCIDEAVSVELDTDTSMLYDFDPYELELIKEA